MTDPDRAQAAAMFGDAVSRETWVRLDRFAAMLVERQAVMNLVAPSTIPTIWTRHIADSLQLLALAPSGTRWLDFGSGAGLPGLVLACALADKAGAEIHLVESIKKKAAFLSEVVTTLGLPAVVHPERIEDFAKRAARPFDVVTARAVASLDKLSGYALPLLKKGAVGLFPKGQDVEAELTQASKSWKIEAELIQSLTDPRGKIVRVTSVAKR